MYRRLEHRRQQAHRYFGQGSDHAAACKYVAQPQECAGNEAGKRPKDSFDIAIRSTAGRHSAAALGKADGDRSDRDPADQKRQWRVGANACSQRSRHRENAGADDTVNDVRGQAPGPDGAQQAGIALVHALDCSMAPARADSANSSK